MTNEEHASSSQQDPNIQSDDPPKGADVTSVGPSTLDLYYDPNKPINLLDVKQTPQVVDTKTIEIPPKSFQPPTAAHRTKTALNRADADDIMSHDILTTIDADWSKVIPSEDDRRTTYTLLARACYDNGSSPYTTYPGLYAVNGKNFHLTDLAAIIRKYTTMRRYAGYWARTIYSLAVYDKEPPSKWMKRGFSHSTRYAAFDFFDALASPQSPPPKAIPEILPPDAEIAANLTHKQIAIARSTNKLKILQPEVNAGGLCSPKPVAYTTSGCQ